MILCFGDNCRKVVSTTIVDQFLVQQVAAAADRPTRRGASHPPCCTQMSPVSVINWWLTTVTSLSHWPSTYVDSALEDRHDKWYGWCPPKFKWFTWPNQAPFRDGLPFTG